MKKISESVNSSPSRISKCLAVRTKDSFTYSMKTERQRVRKCTHVSTFPATLDSSHDIKPKQEDVLQVRRPAVCWSAQWAAVLGRLCHFMAIHFHHFEILKAPRTQQQYSPSSQALPEVGFFHLGVLRCRTGTGLAAYPLPSRFRARTVQKVTAPQVQLWGRHTRLPPD